VDAGCRVTEAGEKSGQQRHLTVSVSGIVCNCNGCPDDETADGVIVIVEVPEGVTMGGGVMEALPTLPVLPQPAS